MNRRRKTSPRLKDYDYKQLGAYFVTTCTTQRLCLFGEILDGKMHLNPSGRIAEGAWTDLPNHYPHVHLDVFIIMPNHVHGIIFLLNDERRDRFRNLSLPDDNHSATPNNEVSIPRQKRHGLSEIMRGFKTWSARRINQHRNAIGSPVWQRSFYDHIIRSYIRKNPLNWEHDQENPNHHQK
jgi:REP element-mobilizing transposase RayT